MAEENEGASRTEEPTPRKLEDARKKGDVAKTQDLPAFASLAAIFGVIAIAGGWMMQNAAQALLPFIARPEQISLSGQGGVIVLREAALAAAPIMLAVMAAAAVAGIFGNVIQHGFLWSGEKLKPDLKRLSILEGFKRSFGVDGLVQFLKSLAKIAAVSLVAWAVLQPKMADMSSTVAMDPLAILPLSGGLLRDLFFAVLALMAAMAGADWLWQRHRFMQRMRMSREELKQDFRQTEGDPHIKAKLRQMRIEKSKRRMMQNVPKATVVVMNPTHYAVALRYEAGETAAPQCVAKGLDALALKIRAVAEEAGVPVVEDPPLARSLYAAVDVDEMIPQQHYEAVAKVIGFVMSGARRARGRAAPALRPGGL